MLPHAPQNPPGEAQFGSNVLYFYWTRDVLQSLLDSALDITLTFHSYLRKTTWSQWKWVLITHYFPQFYSIQILPQLTCLLSTSSFPQVHLKEPCSSFSPSCQGEEKQERKEKARKRRKVANNRAIHSGSCFFPSRVLFARNPTPKHRRILSTILQTPFVPPPIPRHMRTQWEGHLIFPTTAAGRAWPSHGHVTGWETVLGKRILLSSLSSPVSWRGIELPSGVWNRYICLIRGSCHHFEMVWPPKDTTYNMNETCPPSDDAIFFSFNK